jgi:intracellular sulfur oxidation DsrE/DsrF family protein
MRRVSAVAALMAAVWVFLPAITWAEGGGADEKVVYHLDDAANARWALMLASGHLELNPEARIVFVAYGPGVDFLLEFAEDRRGNPYGPTVTDLADKGVDFRVCKTTLDAREIAEDRLIEMATTVPSGTREIVRLQTEEGFAYLKP